MAEYGYTDDSRVKANVVDPKGTVLDDQTVKLWSLDKIQDTVGNYLQVHYAKDAFGGLKLMNDIMTPEETE